MFLKINPKKRTEFTVDPSVLMDLKWESQLHGFMASWALQPVRKNITYVAAGNSLCFAQSSCQDVSDSMFNDPDESVLLSSRGPHNRSSGESCVYINSIPLERSFPFHCLLFGFLHIRFPIFFNAHIFSLHYILHTFTD